MKLNLAALLLGLSVACTGAGHSVESPAPAGASAAPSEQQQEQQQEQQNQEDENEDADANLGGTMEAAASVDLVMSEIFPAEIVLTRGDTITFEGVLRDAEGNRVSGARWGVFPMPAIFAVQSIKTEVPDSYLLWGVGPGETRLQAVLVLSDGSEVEYEPLFDIPVTVKEWPAARIEIDDPAYGTYASSVFQLTGTVITTHDTEHATAVIAWWSSDPEVVSVNGDGVASFNKAGSAEIRAQAEGITQVIEIQVTENPVAKVTLGPEQSEVRTGDVVRMQAELSDRAGRSVDDAHVAYSLSALEGPAGGAVVYSDGAFVAEEAGVYRVMATAGGRAATAVVSAAPRSIVRGAELIGRGAVSYVQTSDLWVFEGRDGRDYAYTGTHAEGGGQRMFVWDVTDRTAPTLMDSIVVDARVVNDVKINDDATLAVITREGASNRKNGMVMLDISDPAHPIVLSEFNDELTGGVHNVWINGDVVYAVNDGTNAMNIIDISDPASPKHVGRWEVRPGEEDKNLHDIWAEDGFAYLSYWDDGLIILDVGAGVKGGTPRDPKFVSQYKYPIGNTHTAFRYGDYVFVGDEIFNCAECTNGPRGYIHVVDVSDIEKPTEVARFEVPEAGAHNIWVEDGLLYVAYYQGGLRVVDVTGELRGDLYAQGRQVSWFHTAASEGEGIKANSPLAWGPHVFKGYVFVSDMNSGLWVVQLEPPSDPLLP